MIAPRAPIQLEGRRLREIRLAPATTASGLALLVLAFVVWILSLFLGSAALATLAGVCAAAAVLIAAAYTWRRLTRRGRFLFGLPAALLPLGLALGALQVPGANIAGFAGALALLAAIALGVVARPSAGATFSLARASVDASLLRSEEPAETLPLLLDARGLHFAPDDPDHAETWPPDQIATSPNTER